MALVLAAARPLAQQTPAPAPAAPLVQVNLGPVIENVNIYVKEGTPQWVIEEELRNLGRAKAHSPASPMAARTRAGRTTHLKTPAMYFSDCEDDPVLMPLKEWRER
ncbi:hypothetical protein SynSYN20_01628 [Synechococcus sp. SYN20]|uniref:hypothetical protein n=1 Tax=Synechococcus sp. SYN20 TaxID=1050714 RepID=UPI001645433B|nr:hypothetical protein [Synechococcus sp. SYN20]QNJ25955.1 hypothetical protein SynSYN20_01628 [Synechococcus sp. SYN20]